jgi:hypothetical protein
MEFVRLIEYSTFEAANQAAKALEAEGIECLITTREKGWLAATDSKAFWIGVTPADFEEAAAILFAWPMENVTLILQCPQCRSLNVKFDAWSYLPFWRKLLPPWWCKEKFFCVDCRNVWEKPPDDEEATEETAFSE